MNFHLPTALLLLLGSSSVYSQTDLLSEDDFGFDSDEVQTKPAHWSDGFKTTLEHTRTEGEDGTYLRRSLVRLQYDQSPVPGWYASVDAKLSRFWSTDVLAEARGGAYTRFKAQQLWLQYSRESCAYKLGRQNIIWGEVEGTFAVDIVAPFDFTEQLLTDYASVRLGQDLISMDCFGGGWQTQMFYTPEARADLYQHGGTPGAETPGSEWGGWYKIKWTGGDLSLMYAHLYPNTPALALTEFDLVGASGTLARGRTLIKWDFGYKTDQTTDQPGILSDVVDLAVGVEYTSPDNHSVNAGIWARDERELSGSSQSPVVTVGWSKGYLNDNLAISLLASWSSDPEISSLTILGEYKWDDYWTLSSALALTEVDPAQPLLPFTQSETALTLAIKYEI